MGRKAIPSKIIALKGGTKHTHRPPRKKEPTPPAKIPTCPSHLNKIAREEWNRAVKLLDEVKIMAELDRATLAAYCEAYARWVEATQEVATNGMVYNTNYGPKISPYYRIAKESLDQMMKIAPLLGMSPSARASLSIVGTNKSLEESEIEAFKRKKHGKKN